MRQFVSRSWIEKLGQPVVHNGENGLIIRVCNDPYLFDLPVGVNYIC